MTGLLVLCREFLQCFAVCKQGAWEYHLSVCLRYFCINILNMMLMCSDLKVLTYRKLFSHQMSVRYPLHQMCHNPNVQLAPELRGSSTDCVLAKFLSSFYSSLHLDLVHISR